MSTSKHALVILWDGHEAPDEIVRRMVAVLCDSGAAIPELIDATQMDAKGIAEHLVGRVPKESKDSVEHACVYIGTLFSNVLKNNGGNFWHFAINLQNAISNGPMCLLDTGVRVALNSDADTVEHLKLKNAVEIIAKAGTVPAKLAKKYNLTDEAVKVITYIYNNYC